MEKTTSMYMVFPFFVFFFYISLVGGMGSDKDYQVKLSST